MPAQGSRSSRNECRNPAGVDLSRGVPGVVRRLHADPHAGTLAEQLAEPHRNLGSDRLPLPQDVVEMLPPLRARTGLTSCPRSVG